MKTTLGAGLGILLSVTGCGSSGAPAAGGSAGSDGGQSFSCPATSTPGSSMSWRIDTVPECAASINGKRIISSEDSLEVSATSSRMNLVEVSVALFNGVKLGGSYVCNHQTDAGAPFISMSYEGKLASDCTITITSSGTPGVSNATGTFSGTFPLLSGGPYENVTDGAFDTAVTLVGN
jgi:hypothetical protein